MLSSDATVVSRSVHVKIISTLQLLGSPERSHEVRINKTNASIDDLASCIGHLGIVTANNHWLNISRCTLTHSCLRRRIWWLEEGELMSFLAYGYDWWQLEQHTVALPIVAKMSSTDMQGSIWARSRCISTAKKFGCICMLQAKNVTMVGFRSRLVPKRTWRLQCDTTLPVSLPH